MHIVQGHLLATTVVYTVSSVAYSVQRFLRATAGTAIARLSHRNSVCLSVTRVIRQKRCKLGSSNLHHQLPKTLLSGSVTLFQKFHRGHPNQGP